jgi:hypothetical protein
MVDLSDAVKLLRAQRKQLAEQLDAVDKALAALGQSSAEILPTRLPPARKLSDEHRQALNDGRRHARHSKEVAAGRARELADPRSGLASGDSGEDRHPRLVKQRKR